MIQAAAVLAALQIAAAPAPDTAGAYEDERAAQLASSARQARATQQATLTQYSTLATERASALLRTPGRDRLVYRREMAARVDWQRGGPGTITLLGAREYVPLPGAGVRVLFNAAQEATDVAFRPDELASTIGLGEFRFGPHPLNPGREADYRFSAGATSTLILQDGSAVQVHELVVLPRRAAPELVSGSIWIEDGTGRIVQEAYRRAAELRPVATPLLGGLALDFREIVLEHGLWEQQWWLPRIIAVDGVVRLGRAAVLPFRYERLYADYTVAGDPALAPEPGAAFQPVAPVPPAERWQVVLPQDRSTLLVSEFLPPTIFDETAPPVGAATLDPLRERLDALAPRLELAGGRAFVELAPLDQVRFNRIEGLSFNVAAGVGSGGVRSFVDARIATAGQVLRGQFGLAAGTTLGQLGFAAFERVHAADPASRPFDAGNSLSTFFFGTDYGQYFTAQGVELVREARPGSRRPWTLRLYTEQQDSVAARDPFTLRDIFGSGTTWLRAGTPVVPATQYGLAFDLAAGRGLGPEQLQWRVLPRLEAALGDFDYGRLSLTGSVSLPLFTAGIGPFREGLSVGFEAAAGTALGDVPGQALWYLGGPATIRGYPPASGAGDGFWRTRAELGTTFPAVRAVLFSDVGRTWGTGGFGGTHYDLAAAGIGLSLLEGLVRVDLARALQFRPGWRMTIAVDNVL